MTTPYRVNRPRPTRSDKLLLEISPNNKLYRSPETSICLNCPLTQPACIGEGIDTKIRQSPTPPACPIAWGVWMWLTQAEVIELGDHTIGRGMGLGAFQSVVSQTIDRRRQFAEMTGEAIPPIERYTPTGKSRGRPKKVVTGETK